MTLLGNTRLVVACVVLSIVLISHHAAADEYCEEISRDSASAWRQCALGDAKTEGGKGGKARALLGRTITGPPTHSPTNATTAPTTNQPTNQPTHSPTTGSPTTRLEKMAQEADRVKVQSKCPGESLACPTRIKARIKFTPQNSDIVAKELLAGHGKLKALIAKEKEWAHKIFIYQMHKNLAAAAIAVQQHKAYQKKQQALTKTSRTCNIELGTTPRIGRLEGTTSIRTPLLEKIKKYEAKVKTHNTLAHGWAMHQNWGGVHVENLHAAAALKVVDAVKKELKVMDGDDSKQQGLCVLPTGQSMMLSTEALRNPHMYCASTVVVDPPSNMGQLACTTKDKGTIVITQKIKEPFRVRDALGAMTDLCVSFLKVSACGRQQGNKNQKCAVQKLLYFCAVCDKNKLFVRGCKREEKNAAAMSV